MVSQAQNSLLTEVNKTHYWLRVVQPTLLPIDELHMTSLTHHIWWKTMGKVPACTLAHDSQPMIAFHACKFHQWWRPMQGVYIVSHMVTPASLTWLTSFSSTLKCTPCKASDITFCTHLLVHTPYDSSTKAKDRFKTRNMKRFLDVTSEKIALRTQWERYQM